MTQVDEHTLNMPRASFQTRNFWESKLVRLRWPIRNYSQTSWPMA